MTRALWIMALSLGAAGLTACSTNTEDLQRWTDEERRRAVPRVQPLKEPATYVPLAYVGASVDDAFDSGRLTKALRRDGVASGATLVAPELNRRKEPLEAYPLDVMSMVGTLQKTGEQVALVKVDQLLHQVRVGNYLGQNYGRVTKITESEVTLREIVQDAAGEWIERSATLLLQENTK